MQVNTKSLKKQLAAAIAMLLVAVVALGTATYAWFVTNNTVQATTSTISAQANAAFMNIKYNDSAVDSDLTADSATIGDTPLYPAQWNTTSAKFETAYAQAVGAATMKADTLTEVGAPDTAVTKEYAVVNTFNISAKGRDVKELKVAGASIDGNNLGNQELDSALRVLVVTNSGWVLCDKDRVVKDSSGGTSGALGDTIVAGENTEVKMYVFYDGNDNKIYTNNLPNLKTASSKITIEFSATDVGDGNERDDHIYNN